MSYREAPAPPALAHLVRCCWTSRADAAAPAPVRVLPDGCADLLLEFEPTLRARWIGTMTRARLVPVAPGSVRFGIRFAPGGLAPLLGAPLGLLTDGDAALDALRPRAWQVPLQALADTTGFEARSRVVWRSIAGALPALAPDHAMLALLAGLEAMPRLPRVEALAAAAGVGRRTLERRFEATLGVSPVQHLRWLRFERARRLLDGGGRAHAHVALDAGYADQAHFIREFARFSGLTPGRWPG